MLKDCLTISRRNLKSSAFGGFTVDKNVVEKYKGLFDKLQA